MPRKQSTEKAESSSDSQKEQRFKAIEHAAYLKAQERGFTPGHEVEDWLAAEREVDQLGLAAD